MLISINPVLLNLWALEIRWVGVLALLGLGVAIWGSLRALERQHLSRNKGLDALAWGLPVGLLSARLVFVLGHWDFFLTNTSEIGQLDLSGLSLWGGLVGGGLVAAARLGPRDAQQRRHILDVIVPFVALGIVIGRFGQFIDGSGQGLPSSLPWATMYASPLAATPDFGVPRHPAQLYDAAVALALCGFAWAVPRAAPAGTRAAVVLVCYAIGRLALGAVRVDPPFLFGLQIEQLLALGVAAYSFMFGARPLLGYVSNRRAAPAGDRATQRARRGKEDSLAA